LDHRGSEEATTGGDILGEFGVWPWEVRNKLFNQLLKSVCLTNSRFDMGVSVKKRGDGGRELSSPENSYLFHPNLRPLVIQPENGMISDDRVTARERE